MAVDSGDAQTEITIQSLRQQLTSFARPNLQKSVLQLITALVPYFGLWAILVFMVTHDASYPGVLAVMLVASLFLVRLFIFFHDCTHTAFFASRRANVIWGYVLGILTFTPFHYWQYNHQVHHGTYADLDHRGIGDIWTLTIEEFRAASKAKRLGYRLYRSPLVFLGIGPGYSFLITQRLLHQWEGKNERFSVMVTNLAIVLVAWVASMTMGLRTYLLIQLPIIFIAGAIGVWLFYVQHQFEGVYWSRHDEWDPLKAALIGSSYYKLPKLAQWFTGNIGLHHVHHVLPRIPNYNLQPCYDQSPLLQSVRPLSFSRSLKSLWLNLWDEKQRQLVSFRSLHRAS